MRNEKFTLDMSIVINATQSFFSNSVVHLKTRSLLSVYSFALLIVNQKPPLVRSPASIFFSQYDIPREINIKSKTTIVNSYVRESILLN